MGAFIIQLNIRKKIAFRAEGVSCSLASYLTDGGIIDQRQTTQENADISPVRVGEGLKLTMLSFPQGQPVHFTRQQYLLLCSDLQSLLSTLDTTSFSELLVHSLKCEYLTSLQKHYYFYMFFFLLKGILGNTEDRK